MEKKNFIESQQVFIRSLIDAPSLTKEQKDEYLKRLNKSLGNLANSLFGKRKTSESTPLP